MEGDAMEDLTLEHQVHKEMILKIREDERIKMARQIQNVFGQSLTILKLELHGLKKNSVSTPPLAEKKFNNIYHLIDELVKSVGKIVNGTPTEFRAELGLKEMIEEFVKDFTSRTDVVVNFASSDQANEVGPEVSSALFRIIQEILTNTIRHTKSKVVDISLLKYENIFLLRARDYHTAEAVFYEKNGRGLGVTTMKERVRNLGGSFAIQYDGGTIVNIAIPEPQL
jgi:signal transduction histidine kinase